MPISINRRTFIKTTLVGFTGLTLGVSLNGACDPTPEPTGDLTLWININENSEVHFVVIKTEMGQGTSTALPMILADELDADWEKVHVHLQAKVDDPAFTGDSMTGGSTAIQTMYQPMREMGAKARDMLLTACAERFSVPKDSLTTEKGLVIHPHAGSLTYGELAMEASLLPIPENVILKDPQEFNLIGQPLLRLDTPGHIEGAPVFGADVIIPGMLYAAVKKSPVFGGRVSNLRSLSLEGTNAEQIVEIPNGLAVVADSWWEAKRALDSLSIEWRTPLGAGSVNSETILAQLEAGISEEGNEANRQGNPEPALENATKTIEATYFTPFLAHATMEPMNCTANVTRDKCEVWVPSQGSEFALARAREITKMAADKVTVYPTYVGGGFGRRLQVDFVEQAVTISKEIQKPVQVFWSRGEDMQQDFYRGAFKAHFSGGLGADNSLDAWIAKLIGPSSPIPFYPQPGNLSGFSDIPYLTSNMKVNVVGVPIDIPRGAWRSVAYSHNIFFVESFIDELANAAGMDPIAFRLAHIENPRLKTALTRVAELSDWGNPQVPGAGQGIALAKIDQTHIATVIEASVNDSNEIVIHKAFVAVDCGVVINPDVLQAQLEGGTLFGLTAAMFGEINIKDGKVVQSNFHNYPLLTLKNAPKVSTAVISSTEAPSGIGEWTVPPAMPALGNAVFAATGHRIRSLPLVNYDFG